MKCPECQQENRSKAVFCSNCGKKLLADDTPSFEKHVNKVNVFFFVMLGFIALLDFTEFQKDLRTILITDAIFVSIIVTFLVIHFNSVKGLFNLARLNPLIIVAVFVSAICMAFAVHSFATYLNRSLFDRTQGLYYEYYKESPYPLLFCIVSIGVVPAIFEEIAFRGILFTELLNVTNKNAVILITSILFTLLHFSVISAIWLFPFALALGYLRARYNTILYGVLAHFTYNTSIVLIQLHLLK
jgi:membrane protease YdiL (CAAX protease family)